MKIGQGEPEKQELRKVEEQIEAAIISGGFEHKTEQVPLNFDEDKR